MVLPFILAAVDPVVSGIEVLSRAAEHQDWWVFALSTLALAILAWASVAGLRKTLGQRWPWLTTRNGGITLVALVAGAEALLLALAGGVRPGAAASQALIAAWNASGFRSWKPKKRKRVAPVQVVPTQESPT